MSKIKRWFKLTWSGQSFTLIILAILLSVKGIVSAP